MSNTKGLLGFIKQFGELLDLTESQVKDIGQLQYDLYKDYHWNSIQSETKFKFVFLRRLFSILGQGQIEFLRKERDELVVKKNEVKKSRFQSKVDHQKKRLASLGLREDQIREFVKLAEDLADRYKEELKALSDRKSIDRELIMKRLNKEMYASLFNEKQVILYEGILEAEKARNTENRIARDKKSFEHQHSIVLSQEQAMSLFEIGIDRVSKDKDGVYFSDFEKEEYKLSIYKNVLTEDQLDMYRPHHLKRLNQIEKNIVKSDDRHLKYLNMIKGYFQYYVENVLPNKCESRQRIEVLLSLEQRNLIQDIKEQYRIKLSEAYDKTEKEHIKYNRGLAANEWDSFLIRNKLSYVIINTHYLRDSESANRLMSDSDLISILKSESKKLEKVFSDLKEFEIENYEKNGGSYGTHIMKVGIEEGKEHLRYISILLIESNLDENIIFLQ